MLGQSLNKNDKKRIRQRISMAKRKSDLDSECDYFDEDNARRASIHSPDENLNRLLSAGYSSFEAMMAVYGRY